MSSSTKKQKYEKFLPLLVSLLFIALLAGLVLSIKKSGYHLIYSPTPSMPIGFYFVMPTKKIKKMDIVEFTPPKDVLQFVRENRWVPKRGKIIKYVFALPGDKVCIKNDELWINNEKICKIHKYYDENKLLPQTKFCGKLKDDQYLLLSTKNERSFDGRYFGPIEKQKITGRAVPILTIK